MGRKGIGSEKREICTEKVSGKIPGSNKFDIVICNVKLVKGCSEWLSDWFLLRQRVSEGFHML